MRARFGRFGPLENYAGAHVLDWHGRLAQIESLYRNETRGIWLARLRRFNGEDAGEQSLSTLEILEREDAMTDDEMADQNERDSERLRGQ